MEEEALKRTTMRSRMSRSIVTDFWFLAEHSNVRKIVNTSLKRQAAHKLASSSAEHPIFVPQSGLALQQHRATTSVSLLSFAAEDVLECVQPLPPRCRLKNASDAFLVGKFNERFVVFLQRGCALLCLEPAPHQLHITKRLMAPVIVSQNRLRGHSDHANLQGECSETWKLYLVLENENLRESLISTTYGCSQPMLRGRNRFYARISQVKLFRKTRKSLSVFCSHVSCRPGVVQRRSCESELEFQQQLSPRY